jgi:hypothetical protein
MSLQYFVSGEQGQFRSRHEQRIFFGPGAAFQKSKSTDFFLHLS